MKAAEAKVGIVTVLYNSAAVLPDFIASLAAQRGADWHLWAVDNCSRDTSLPQLQAWGDARLTVIANADNQGIATGNNQGIEAALAAGCTHVLLLNNDVRFGPDLVAGLVQGLEEHGCDITVPKTYCAEPGDILWFAGGTFQKHFALLPVHFGKGEQDRGQYDVPCPVTYAPACCTMVRREVFDRIGLMDERFFVYSDDVDFMHRAALAGVSTWYLPAVQLWHKVSSLTVEDSPFSQRYLTRGRALFIRKHLSWPAMAWFTLLYRSYYVVRFLLRRDRWAELVRKERAWSEGLSVR